MCACVCVWGGWKTDKILRMAFERERVHRESTQERRRYWPKHGPINSILVGFAKVQLSQMYMASNFIHTSFPGMFLSCGYIQCYQTYQDVDLGNNLEAL